MGIERLIQRLAIAAMMLLASATAASALVIEIATCQALTVPGAAYRVTSDLLACGDCLVVEANRISIDVQGFVIEQDVDCFGGAAITDAGVARDVVTVRNGFTFSDEFGAFDNGVDLRASTRTEVRTFLTVFNAFDGIAVGNRALVKEVLSLGNGDNGISGGDFVQVEASGAFLNGLFGEDDVAGIRVGNRCLVTLNEASGNVDDGILTGANCTVTRNVADFNESGISVEGPGSLVSHNSASDNLNEGFEVQCPSTVTHNFAANNGENYALEGDGCFFKDNQG